MFFNFLFVTTIEEFFLHTFSDLFAAKKCTLNIFVKCKNINHYYFASESQNQSLLMLRLTNREK